MPIAILEISFSCAAAASSQVTRPAEAGVDGNHPDKPAVDVRPVL